MVCNTTPLQSAKLAQMDYHAPCARLNTTKKSLVKRSRNSTLSWIERCAWGMRPEKQPSSLRHKQGYCYLNMFSKLSSRQRLQLAVSLGKSPLIESVLSHLSSLMITPRGVISKDHYHRGNCFLIITDKSTRVGAKGKGKQRAFVEEVPDETSEDLKRELTKEEAEELFHARLQSDQEQGLRNMDAWVNQIETPEIIRHSKSKTYEEAVEELGDNITSLTSMPIDDSAITNGVSCGSLMMAQTITPLDDPLIAPNFFRCDKYFPISLRYEHRGSYGIIHSERGYFRGRRIELELGTDRFDHCRHDFVGNFCEASTDVLFSEIDPNCDDECKRTDHHGNAFHKMTPDFYDPESKAILELGTTVNTDDQKVMDAYSGKVMQYKDYYKRAGLNKNFVLIVGPNAVATNMNITQAMADDLCARLKFGISMEAEISETLGENVFRMDGDFSSRMKSVATLLAGLNVEEGGSRRKPHEEFNYSEDEINKIASGDFVDNARVGKIMMRELRESYKKIKAPASDLDDYLRKFITPDSVTEDAKLNTHPLNHMKRVCNIPFIYSTKLKAPEYRGLEMQELYVNKNTPPGLTCVLRALFSSRAYVGEDNEFRVDEIEAAEEIGITDFNKERHKNAKHHLFKLTATDEEKVSLALSGIQPSDVESRVLQEKIDDSHRGFHPNAYTEDIQQFINGKRLTFREHAYSIHKTMNLMPLLIQAKRLAQGLEDSAEGYPLSIKIFKELCLGNELVQHADMISNLFIEMSFGVKHFTKRNLFLFKYLRNYKAGFVMKNTGTHIFVSFIFDKETSRIIDPGRIGPEIFEYGDYWVTDFCSYTPSVIEHFVKSGPYMASLACRQAASFQIPFQTIVNGDIYTKRIETEDDGAETFPIVEESDSSSETEKAGSTIDEDLDPEEQFSEDTKYPQYWQSLKTIYLLYLNNKTDAEEIITAQRYFFMNILDEYNPNPYLFVERLPEVLRSRLTSYLVSRTISNMHYYATKPVMRKIQDDDQDKEFIEYSNLRPIVCQNYVPLELLIDTFYYGYVVTKEKMEGAHNNLAICKKLFKEEFKHLDNEKKGIPVFGQLMRSEAHRADTDMLGFFIKSFRRIMEVRIGENFKVIKRKEIIGKFVGSQFSDLATLKASGNSGPVNATVEKEIEDLADEFRDDSKMPSFKDFKEKIRASNKEFQKRRPRAIQAIDMIAREFEEKVGRAPSMLFELVPFCLRSLKSNKIIGDFELEGGFDSDLFSKSQHGGFREIHILEMKARICQYFFELISRSYCSTFRSETITHPREKGMFVKEHLKKCYISFDKFVTIGKSADAKTWCQNHFPSRFAAMMIGLTDPLFHPFIHDMMWLWVHKRVNMPLDVVTMFASNAHTPIADPVSSEMRKRFYAGDAPFIGKMGKKCEIKSGMFQGILHYCSSLYHTMVQEVMAEYESMIAKLLFKLDMVVTKVQGSDDSGSLNSFPIKDPGTAELNFLGICGLMRFKEKLAAYITIIPSEAKTAYSVLSIIEYNSEWFIRQKSCKPTFRWVSACMELTVEENFISRMRIMNNVLTQTLEGGASTLECSLIQLCQAWLHYKLLGLDVHFKFKKLVDKFKEFPDPTCGFFPLEPDISAGVTGLDFSIWRLCRASGYGASMVSLESLSDNVMLDIEGVKSARMNKLIKNYKLSFSSVKSWERIVKDMNVPSLDDLLEQVDANPKLIFAKHTSWEDDRVNIMLKVYTPGVKASLSTRQPLIRMMVSSAYLLTHPCIWERSSKSKMSLLQMCENRMKNALEEKSRDEGTDPDLSLRMLFPMHDSYKNMEEFVIRSLNTAIYTPEEMSKRDKVTLEVFANTIEDEYELINLCKRQWFDMVHSVHTGRNHFTAIWNNVKAKYPWLKDTFNETKEELGLDAFQLKHFIESISVKTRRVQLVDTQAKGSNVTSVLTRIFWPNIKIRFQDEPDNIITHANDLRSTLFAITSFIYNDNYNGTLVRELLSTSPALIDSEYDNLPMNLRPLKIFSDVLRNSEDRLIIIARIRHLKRGVMGFFSSRQAKYDAKRKHRTGEGEWRGFVHESSAIITMKDNVVTDITLNNTSEPIVLARRLKELIDEFKCRFPDSKSVPTASKLYLNRSGKFEQSMYSQTGLIPIKIVPDYEFLINSLMPSTNWWIESGINVVRLKTVDARGVKITIFSERLKLYDWNPESQFLVDDELLRHWHNSENINYTTLENYLMSIWPKNNVDLRLRKAGREGKLLNLDVHKFRTMIEKQCDKLSNHNHYMHLATVETADDDLGTEAVESSGGTAEYFMNILTNDLLTQGIEDDELNTILERDQEAMNMREEDGDLVQEVEADRLDSVMALLSIGASDDAITEALNTLRTHGVFDREKHAFSDFTFYGMPPSNNSLYTIGRMIDEAATQSGYVASTAWMRSINSPIQGSNQLSGRLISIYHCKDLVSKYESLEAESSVSVEESQANTSVATSTFTVHRLQEKISTLKESLENGPSEIGRRHLLSLLHENEQKLKRIASAPIQSYDGLANFDKTKVLLELIIHMDRLENLKVFRSMDDDTVDENRTNDPEILMVMIKSWLIENALKFAKTREAREGISLSLKDEYFRALREPRLTDTLVDLLCLVLKSNIRFTNRKGETTHEAGDFNRVIIIPEGWYHPDLSEYEPIVDLPQAQPSSSRDLHGDSVISGTDAFTEDSMFESVRDDSHEIHEDNPTFSWADDVENEFYFGGQESATH